MTEITRLLTIALSLIALTCIVLTGCTAANIPEADTNSQAENNAADTCPVTDPEWLKPPEDSAVQGSPEFGYYYANEDRSILASSWWTEQEENYLRANEEGIKVGWFRPEGAELEITGQRIDAQAPPLEAHVPCCYPTRFQPSGLQFPTEGCWNVVAKAVDSELSFIIWVES